MSRDTVILNGLTVPLRSQVSLAAAFDAAGALHQHPARGMYACLGLCWGADRKLQASFEDSYDALKYGGQVFDELINWGASVKEITDASTAALSCLVAALPSDKEVQAAEGNCEDQEGSIST